MLASKDALTHDIVWMENRVIDGQTVLVPVLYLAQAESRNVRGNSLIQGRDLNLVTGGDLINVGTLRASNNLTAASRGGSIYTGGLVEAGHNLSLLADDSIRNAMAGEIRGKQVSLAALKGDITNDTTAIQVRDGAGMRTLTDTSAGTIVARENLAMDAGRDLTNRGALVAGNDVTLRAGRDLNLIAASDTSVKHEIRDGGEKSSITTDVKNLAASVTAGGNLTMKAGQDVNVIGSSATAGKDLTVEAGRDFNVASVSDMHNVEGKEKHGKKRIKTSDDQTTQVASVLTAGGDFVSQAGRDTTIVASKISAGNEAYLYSGDKLSLLAAQDSTHTLYDMKKNSGWGSKKTQRDEVTRITNVGTEIKTGGDLILKSEGDQTYQLAKLQSGKDITLDSGGAITFEAVKDLHQESHEKSNNNAFWVSSKGKGNTDETVRQSQLIAEGNVAIKAVAGLKIDINQVNQKTVSQSIDAMVNADPQLAWIKDAEKRGDVDWRQVKEIHDSFKYSNSGLGPASQIIIAIVMAAVVGPLAAVAAGGGTVGAVAGAVAAGASTNATVSVVNNRGNLGAVLKDVTSSDAMKGYVIAGATAGLTAEYFGDWTGTETNTATGKITTPGILNSWRGVGQFAANQTLQSGTSMLLSKALGQGGSASDALKNALFNTLAAASFNLVGNYTKDVFADGSPPKIAIHAMVGGSLPRLQAAILGQVLWQRERTRR
ncbi:hemagglutinin repeat-containing protein [Pseudomonas trivialis]|uniref:hemagglutinin repeat-containing protein n=1 Tax=Pseudomonas trivialis TaxID=200450 RepID=UPI003BB08CF4